MREPIRTEKTTMPPADLDAWKRLGRLLADRRVQIGARYKNKNLFATEREINRRMLWQVESGERDTYRPDTIRAIESAYMLVPGSLERTLAGGNLEPAGHAPPERPRPTLAEVPHAGMEPELVVRLSEALVRVAARGEVAKAKQEILALILESRRTDAQKAEMILDLLNDDPSLPVDWDQPGGDSARHA